MPIDPIESFIPTKDDSMMRRDLQDSNVGSIILETENIFPDFSMFVPERWNESKMFVPERWNESNPNEMSPNIVLLSEDAILEDKFELSKEDYKNLYTEADMTNAGIFSSFTAPGEMKKLINLSKRAKVNLAKDISKLSKAKCSQQIVNLFSSLVNLQYYIMIGIQFIKSSLAMPLELISSILLISSVLMIISSIYELVFEIIKYIKNKKFIKLPIFELDELINAVDKSEISSFIKNYKSKLEANKDFYIKELSQENYDKLISICNNFAENSNELENTKSQILQVHLKAFHKKHLTPTEEQITSIKKKLKKDHPELTKKEIEEKSKFLAKKFLMQKMATEIRPKVTELIDKNIPKLLKTLSSDNKSNMNEAKNLIALMKNQNIKLLNAQKAAFVSIFYTLIGSILMIVSTIMGFNPMYIKLLMYALTAGSLITCYLKYFMTRMYVDSIDGKIIWKKAVPETYYSIKSTVAKIKRKVSSLFVTKKENLIH